MVDLGDLTPTQQQIQEEVITLEDEEDMILVRHITVAVVDMVAVEEEAEGEVIMMGVEEDAVDMEEMGTAADQPPVSRTRNSGLSTAAAAVGSISISSPLPLHCPAARPSQMASCVPMR